jgi:hypothetical protein
MGQVIKKKKSKISYCNQFQLFFFSCGTKDLAKSSTKSFCSGANKRFVATGNEYNGWIKSSKCHCDSAAVSSCTIVAQGTNDINRVSDKREALAGSRCSAWTFQPPSATWFPVPDVSNCRCLAYERYTYEAEQYRIITGCSKRCLYRKWRLTLRTKLVYVTSKRHVLATRGNGVLKLRYCI